jgi:hypothetical protein
MSKYFLSLCAIIKDERNLEEFIIYNWILGVEHFYIYDNGSEYPIRNRLYNYLFTQMCTVIDFPGSNQQINAYNHCRNNYGHETMWMANIDADEFICPRNHWSIRDFLSEYPDAHAIGINWVFFGTSFHNNIQNNYIIDAYRYCNTDQDKHIKTIYKPEYTYNFLDPHHVSVHDSSKYLDARRNIINGPFNYNYTKDIIQINHYFTRSLEDSYIKKNRGRADGHSFGNLLNNNNIDEIHLNHNDIIDNYCADKYLPHLINMMNALHTNWEIYRALNPDLDQRFITSYDFYKHLYEYGLRENRHLKITDKYPNFNRDIYRKNYADLAHLNDTDVEKQYIYNGYSEGRICDREI